MKIDSLYIESFKNLHHFRVDFDQFKLTTVIVGRNGTGKSNLLEALVLIFRHLDLGEDPPFKYEIRYECRGRSVTVDADPTKSRNKVGVIVDKERRRFSRTRKGENRDFLPSFVFGYYSGASERMELELPQFGGHLATR